MSAGSIVGIVLAVIMLLIVMLPLFWMIVTAFKVKGTAFRLTFIPQTTIYDPPLDQPPFPLADLSILPTGKAYAHLEYADSGATNVHARVMVKLTKGADQETTFALFRTYTGLWFRDAAVPRNEPIAISYVVNDDQANPKPAHKDDRMTLAEGYSVIGASTFSVTRERGKAHAAIPYDAAFQRIQIQDATGARHDLSIAGGTLDGSFDSDTTPTYRVVQTRSFGDAVRSMYTFENFRGVVWNKDFSFATYFFNSLVVATSAGLLTVLICTLAGYAFAQLQFHFRDAIFTALLATMLVPGMIFMVPQFSITIRLGLMDSYAGMIVPHLANIFGLFLLRQYIGQIPKDLFSAAEIDGARQHQIFRTIVIPFCLPIMVTLFLLVFVGQWSNFLWQLIINTGQSHVLTLPVGLQQFKGQNANEWEKIMAGACFSILPMAVLFMTMQKYFMQGLTAGAVKE
ncbi:hypothetical protein BH09SUM1_BH09SUM1_08940 [soil metagenome]